MYELMASYYKGFARHNFSMAKAETIQELTDRLNGYLITKRGNTEYVWDTTYTDCDEVEVEDCVFYLTKDGEWLDEYEWNKEKQAYTPVEV